MLICREIGGVQSQLDTAAYQALWTRSKGLSRAAIEAALWRRRTLVKTSLMRQTIHLIPADEFHLYIAALRANRIAGALGVMARCGISPKEADHFTTIIMKTVDDLSAETPVAGVARRALRDAVRPQVSKKIQKYMDKVWSIVRLPVAEGLLCYGENQGSEAVWVRADHWLSRPKSAPEEEAQNFLFRRYLAAYGPASLRDFSKWAGISAKDAARIGAASVDSVVEVTAAGTRALLLRKDCEALAAAGISAPVVRLLPHFDTFVLGHVDKSSLVDMRHYKKVYRNQGWISPVLLIDGRIAGTWSYALRSGRLVLGIKPFGKLARTLQEAIEVEAQSLAVFFGYSSPPVVTIRS
ncbi:MAG TPA: winged helix DNA-binding domain-containing protein [Alphaproteobacteria bacterium]|nr:winged helix DNA-binding domain-containing protein [Alphaproteobacteria bacterium]